MKNLIDDICAKQHEFDNHINAIYSQHFLYETYDESLLTMYQWMNDTDELVPEAELIEELRPGEEEKTLWRTRGEACLASARENGVNCFLFPGDLDAEYVEWLQVQLQVAPVEVQGYYMFCPAK